MPPPKASDASESFHGPTARLLDRRSVDQKLEHVETFRAGRRLTKRSFKVTESMQTFIGRLARQFGTRASVLTRAWSSLDLNVRRSRRWPEAMRECLKRWEQTGEEPSTWVSADLGSPGSPPPRVTRVRAGIGEPAITVRDVSLAWTPGADDEGRGAWTFSIRLSVEPAKGKRVSIIGDDCEVHILNAPSAGHRGRRMVSMLLRTLQVNRGPVVERVDLDEGADLHLHARAGQEEWSGPRPKELLARVELVAVMHRWARSLWIELVLVADEDHDVRWAGYGEAPASVVPMNTTSEGH